MRRRAGLLLIAAIVVLADRISKTAIDALAPGAAPREIFGSLVRIARGENRGGLFGLLQGSAPLLAALSVGVIALLILAHERERTARLSLLTVAIGALAGGAIGNLVDRVAYGYVLDFIDIGIGTARFWTFNLADAAITLGILLLLADALLPAVPWSRKGDRQR